MLYIVATPIGNLQDITLRALHTLKSVTFIIAENPTHTQQLLKHFGIAGKKLIQFADHNETRMLPSLIKQLRDVDGCLVTDAGTPGISDPGFRLVRECIKEQIDVTPIPGVNAATGALSASGLPTDRFLFLGFLQKTEPKVIEAIKLGQLTDSTIIFYESPQRILKTIGYIAKQFPDAHVVIARELTKMHEEFIRGTATAVLNKLKNRSSIKGEITVLVSFK